MKYLLTAVDVLAIFGLNALIARIATEQWMPEASAVALSLATLALLRQREAK